MNRNKNIVLTLAISMLFLALLDGWQYGFFTMLRFVVCTTTGWVAWMAYREQKVFWVWTYGFVSVLFNPFIPVYLNRDTWVVIDFLVGIFLLVSIFLFKVTYTKTEES